MNSENAKLKTKEEQSLLRLPPGMRDKIAAVAKQNNRSINAEIIHRLTASFAVPSDIVDACNSLDNVHDRIDFAVRIFQRAGVQIVMPEKEKDL